MGLIARPVNVAAITKKNTIIIGEDGGGGADGIFTIVATTVQMLIATIKGWVTDGEDGGEEQLLITTTTDIAIIITIKTVFKIWPVNCAFWPALNSGIFNCKQLKNYTAIAPVVRIMPYQFQ